MAGMRQWYRRLFDPKVNVPVVFVAAIFMAIMDSTIVTVALPDLGKEFHVSIAAIDGVVVAYLVSLAVVIPASGWLGDHWGTKRVLLLALVLFSVASALCGIAQNLPMLISFRVLQGLAGGALTPVGTTMLYRTFPPAERVRVSRILNIPTSIAPAAGPVIGGFLVQQFSWRWIFYVNVPIGVIAYLFGLFFLQKDRRCEATGPFDLLGFLLGGVGLALLMFAVTEGPNAGWSLLLYSFLLAGALCLTLFIIVELRMRKREPLLNLRLYKDRMFRTASLTFLFVVAGFIGVLYILPLFLQEARGLSPLISGLTTFPEALGLILSTQMVARIYPYVGPRRLIFIGQTAVTVLICLFLLINFMTNLWLVRVLIFFIGISIAYTFIPIQTAAYTNISIASTGKAAALYNAQRQIGSALGVAAVSTALKLVGPVTMSAHGTPQPNLAAYHLAFLVAAVPTFIAAWLALFIHDSDAAATMQRPPRTEEILMRPDPIALSAACLLFIALVFIAVFRYRDAASPPRRPE